jgi:hypothetical protein
MQEKIDILPLQGRNQELLDPKRAEPENTEKRSRGEKTGKQKYAGAKRSKKKASPSLS